MHTPKHKRVCGFHYTLQRAYDLRAVLRIIKSLLCPNNTSIGGLGHNIMLFDYNCRQDDTRYANGYLVTFTCELYCKHGNLVFNLITNGTCFVVKEFFATNNKSCLLAVPQNIWKRFLATINTFYPKHISYLYLLTPKGPCIFKI